MPTYSIENVQRQAIFLGMLLLLVGMLVGFVFGFSIIRGWAEEGIRAWRVAHTILITSGMLNLGVGAILPYLVIPQKSIRPLWWAIVYASYDLVIMTPIMALTMERGMHPRASILAAVIFLGFLTGSIANVVAIVILLKGAYRKLRGVSVD